MKTIIRPRYLSNTVGALFCFIFLIDCAGLKKFAESDGSAHTATKPSPQQAILIQKGIALHDRGKYDDAIFYYKEALKLDQNCVLALYELSFSYFEKGDYENSLKYSKFGLDFESKLKSKVYVIYGSSLDNLGRPNEAIEAFKTAIIQYPDEYLLYYNLALTFFKIENYSGAIQNTKKSVSLNPKHSSSHFLLGKSFFFSGYKTQAILAISRFLVLEPSSDRTNEALSLVKATFSLGVSKTGIDSTTGQDKISLQIPGESIKGEGDYHQIDLGLAFGEALKYSDENKNKTEMELLIERYTSLFTMLEESKAVKKDPGFVGKYYVPYFLELSNSKHTEKFCYHIFRSDISTKIQRWLEKHSLVLLEFLSWSNSYIWSKEYLEKTSNRIQQPAMWFASGH